MSIAEDVLRSFIKQYPEVNSGKLSLEELNKLLAEFQDKRNKSPLDDFDGLSPAQMHILLEDPLSEHSVLKFKNLTDEHLDRIPLFKLSELLLEEIRESGKLKLTVTGNLPVRVCELLYNQKLITWEYMEYIKKVREDDVPFIWPLKFYLLNQGIIKGHNNTLSLTKNGEKYMKESKADRFRKLFFFFTMNFSWVNLYRVEDNGKCGQLGWAFSLVLLSKYGDKPQESEFYSLKLIKAFEKGLPEKSMENYHRAYAYRFFDCFANWVGLVNIERKKDFKISLSNQLIITKSELFEHLFEVMVE